MDENQPYIISKMASEQKFFIDRCLPGLNDIINYSNSNRYKWNREKSDIEEYIGWCIREYKISPTESSVNLQFVWIEPNRKRDPDNIVAARKMILDALVNSDIIPNDGWKHIETFADTWEVAKKDERPGVIVTIMEVMDL